MTTDARNATDSFSVATAVTELNTPSEEGSVAISDDGLYLVLTRGIGTEPHLFEASRTTPTGTFSTPTLIAGIMVTGAGDTGPWLVSELSSTREEVGTRLSRNGRTIYFAYDAVRGGGQNAQIWTATRSLACGSTVDE